MAQTIQHAKHNLKHHAFGMIVLLIVQYLLGMTSNLFVKFPESKNGGQLWIFAWHQLPLVLHIIVGYLLFLGTIALLIRSIMNKRKSWIVSSTIALIAILGAMIAGSLFIPTQTDAYSFIMALAFIIALLGYFWGIYTNR